MYIYIYRYVYVYIYIWHLEFLKSTFALCVASLPKLCARAQEIYIYIYILPYIRLCMYTNINMSKIYYRGQPSLNRARASKKYTCIYIHIYLRIYIYTNIHLSIDPFISLSLSKYIYIYTHIYIIYMAPRSSEWYVRILRCIARGTVSARAETIYIYIYILTYIRIYMYTNKNFYLSISLCLYLCIHHIIPYVSMAPRTSEWCVRILRCIAP